MSGLVAVIHLDGRAVDPLWLEAATAFMRFRGPDAQQSWHQGSVGLGHTLFRTTFESAREEQPCTLDGQVWLVADARIDDRQRLIAELRGHNRIPHHDSANDIPDPLLILHAYRQWGEQCLDHLIGDFAFVLWDGPARRLFCARDQMGVAPLYYTHVGQTLLISNTLKVLRRYPGFSSTIDETAIADFLLFQSYLETDSTIFTNIRRLPPAHKLTITLDSSQGNFQSKRPQIQRYWQLPEQVEFLRARHPQEIVERFRFHFEQAVADRLRTDKAGSALSGGLDSTSIAVTAQRLLKALSTPGELRAATVVYRETMQEEEGPFAQQVADFGGFTTTYYFAEDYAFNPPDAEPAYPNPEPWTLCGVGVEDTLQQEMSDFARIYFMGFGGDPLFVPTRLPWVTALQLGQFRSIARTLRRRWRLRKLRSFSTNYEQTVRAYISPELAAKVDIPARQARYRQQVESHDARRAMSFAPLWETFFRVTDPGFSGRPLKTRFPFFDIRLVEFMMRVPPDPWCRSKFLLREAMRGSLPESVRLRPKTLLQNLPTPKQFYPEGAPAWMHELAALPALAEYVNAPALQSELLQPENLTSTTLRSLFSRLILAHWLRHVNNGR